MADHDVAAIRSRACCEGVTAMQISRFSFIDSISHIPQSASEYPEIRQAPERLPTWSQHKGSLPIGTVKVSFSS